MTSVTSTEFSHCLAAVLGGTLISYRTLSRLKSKYSRTILCSSGYWCTVWNRLPAHIVTADTAAFSVKSINSLSAHFLASDFDYSYGSFFVVGGYNCFL